MEFSRLGTGFHSAWPVLIPERTGCRTTSFWGVCEFPDQWEKFGARCPGEAAGVRGDARALHRGHLQEIGVSKSNEGAETVAASRSGNVVHPFDFLVWHQLSSQFSSIWKYLPLWSVSKPAFWWLCGLCCFCWLEKAPQYVWVTINTLLFSRIATLIRWTGDLNISNLISLRPHSVHQKNKPLKRKHFFSDPHSVKLENYPIHTITGILKQWLRELPDPLMTSAQYNDFLRAVGRFWRCLKVSLHPMFSYPWCPGPDLAGQVVSS